VQSVAFLDWKYRPATGDNVECSDPTISIWMGGWNLENFFSLKGKNGLFSEEKRLKKFFLKPEELLDFFGRSLGFSNS